MRVCALTQHASIDVYKLLFEKMYKRIISLGCFFVSVWLPPPLPSLILLKTFLTIAFEKQWHERNYLHFSSACKHQTMISNQNTNEWQRESNNGWRKTKGGWEWGSIACADVWVWREKQRAKKAWQKSIKINRNLWFQSCVTDNTLRTGIVCEDIRRVKHKFDIVYHLFLAVPHAYQSHSFIFSMVAIFNI